MRALFQPFWLGVYECVGKRFAVASVRAGCDEGGEEVWVGAFGSSREGRRRYVDFSWGGRECVLTGNTGDGGE